MNNKKQIVKQNTNELKYKGNITHELLMLKKSKMKLRVKMMTMMVVNLMI